MRMRKKKWAQPELDACPYFIADCDRYRGQWRTLFPKAQPLHVELGCGKGVSTAAMAHAEQDTNFVAIDLVGDVLGSARRNIAAAYGAESVDNIRLTSKNILFIDRDVRPGGSRRADRHQLLQSLGGARKAQKAPADPPAPAHAIPGVPDRRRRNLVQDRRR